jgi:hypothetical protein
MGRESDVTATGKKREENDAGKAETFQIQSVTQNKRRIVILLLLPFGHEVEETDQVGGKGVNRRWGKAE